MLRRSRVEQFRRFMRRASLVAYRFLRHPRRRRENRFNAWLGRLAFDRQLWHASRRSFSGGLAVGLFVAMQPIPFQMVVAAILACWFRVLIPIAVGAVWITNPLTVAPILILLSKFGEKLTTWSNFTLPVLHFENRSFKLDDLVVNLLAGTVVGGLLLAALGYLLAQLLWDPITVKILPPVKEKIGHPVRKLFSHEDSSP